MQDTPTLCYEVQACLFACCGGAQSATWCIHPDKWLLRFHLGFQRQRISDKKVHHVKALPICRLSAKDLSKT